MAAGLATASAGASWRRPRMLQASRSVSHLGQNRIPMNCRLFIAAMMLLFFAHCAEAKPKKYSGNSKGHWKLESQCSKTTCAHLHPDENDDCVSKCVSENCYKDIYGNEPLEPGEVDRTRQGKFSACVKKETDEKKAEARNSR
eukprot:TRINITY_DN46127_c0_g1_i1.p1 TRINITY_DN46127_c0_g1~~TRINITY_DN46127_c0_g1_i1.p1  ORF type:complete len:143 (-),score=21.07 TRINITY_DN46127_c0_g1_i1:200-628(-)